MDIPSRLGKLRVKDSAAETSLRDVSFELKFSDKQGGKDEVRRYKPTGITPSPAIKKEYLFPKIVVHASIEEQIKARFQGNDDYTLFPESPISRGPCTFAEAIMGARSRGRRSAKNDFEPPSIVPEALGQVGIFKVTRKKLSKWVPLDYSTAESTSVSASTSDVEVEESRSPRLSRRSSLNPTAPEFELQSQVHPHDLTNIISSPCSSNSRVEENYEAKAIGFGEKQIFELGATSAGRATGVSAYSPRHVFGVDTSAYGNKENGTNCYQDKFTSLKHTFRVLEGERRIQYYDQESQSSKYDDHQSWESTIIFDTDPDSTPRFTKSSLHALISPGPDSKSEVNLQTFHSSVPNSTKPSQIETCQAMAHLSSSNSPKHSLKSGEDAFDSFEWDPELPTAASPDSSPEPVPIKPQPVAYTTVGSLVNPNYVHQFSAPNRIQREGANRRPLISLLSTSRQYDSVLQPRGPPPPLSMTNSMHYAQQIAQSPVQFTAPSSTNSARSPRYTSRNNLPNRLEDATLMRQFLGKEPRELSDTVHKATDSPVPSKKYSSSAIIPSRQLFSITELIEEEQHVRSNSAPGYVQGLEKMQTLQRLAKFANPMQELARSRLAEFSLLKSQTTGKSVANPTGMSAQEILLSSQIGMSSKTNATADGEGELDLAFRFPPPGLGPVSMTQANTLVDPSSTTLLHTTCAAARPGYPEPLTAGPPGRQRQYNTSSNQLPTQYHEIWFADYGTQQYNPYSDSAVSSAWNNQYTAQPTTQSEFFQPHAGHVKSNVVDTIDPNSLSNYYCAGYPGDMTGSHQPISEENARLMVEGPSKNLPKEVRDARRDEATSALYEVGQRRYNLMNADDYMKELEDAKRYQNEKQKNPFGAIGPSKKKVLPPAEPKPFTEDEIKNKPITELVPPALESGWGALAGYSASEVPGSNSDLSGLVGSPEWQIDRVGEGNKTYFGEDWGAPPKGSTPVDWDD